MSNFISTEIIDEIQRRVDILDIVGRHVNLKRTGKNYVGLCPFHSEDTASFTVTPEKQIFYCFGCQKGGDVINFVKEVENLTFAEAAKKLAEECGIKLPERKMSAQEEETLKKKHLIESMHTTAADFYAKILEQDPQAAKAREYMKQRAIPHKLAQAFNMGYAPDNDWEALSRYLLAKGTDAGLLQQAGLGGKSEKTGKFYDKFHSRLIFPICDYKGQVIAFGGRVLEAEGIPKYLNSTETPIYNKSKNLYGLHIAAPNIRKYGSAVIMEGYMDVVIAHSYGVDNAVASLGTAFTPEQAKLLRRYTEKVILSYDGDDAGQKATLRGIEILRAQAFDIRVLTLPDGMDPDDFLRANGKDGWNRFVENSAQGVLEYLLATALKKHDVSTVSGKGMVVQDLLQPISKTKSNVERDSFINLMAQKLGVSAQTIYADLAKSGLKLTSEIPKIKPAVSKIITSAAAASRNETTVLLRLAIEDKKIFEETAQTLGLDFWPHKEEKALIALITKQGGAYDWNPASLLHRINETSKTNEQQTRKESIESTEEKEEIEGLRDFLLKLLSTEIPEGNKTLLAEHYIKDFRKKSCQKEAGEILLEIQRLGQDPSGNRELQTKLTQRYTELQQQIQQLKNT